jgi:hypothetical protein
LLVSQARFQKQQREKSRREKAAAKSARREQRRSEAEEAADPPSTPGEQAAVLAELAALHARFDDGNISFEDFETEKELLTTRLNI